MNVKIDDVSSDLEDPPQFFVTPPEQSAFDLEGLKRPIDATHGDMANLELPLSPAEGFGLVRLLVTERGWKVTGQDEVVRRMQAVAGSALLRNQSDVVIEVRPRSGGCIVAMRSRSRKGGGSGAAEVKRIRKFFTDL